MTSEMHYEPRWAFVLLGVWLIIFVPVAIVVCAVSGGIRLLFCRSTESALSKAATRVCDLGRNDDFHSRIRTTAVRQ